jgi:hypothetical protein
VACSTWDKWLVRLVPVSSVLEVFKVGYFGCHADWFGPLSGLPSRTSAPVDALWIWAKLVLMVRFDPLFVVIAGARVPDFLFA